MTTRDLYKIMVNPLSFGILTPKNQTLVGSTPCSRLESEKNKAF